MGRRGDRGWGGDRRWGIEGMEWGNGVGRRGGGDSGGA